MGIFVVFLVTVFLIKVAVDIGHAQSETRLDYFTYQSRRYTAGTEFLIKDLNSDEIINAVFLYYDKGKKLNYYEPIIGNQVVHCPNEWLSEHIIQITGNSYNLNSFHVEKAKYNNFMYTCPMCHSRKVKSISTGKKVASGATLGVFSSNLGRNYECSDCSYKW